MLKYYLTDSNKWFISSDKLIHKTIDVLLFLCSSDWSRSHCCKGTFQILCRNKYI